MKTRKKTRGLKLRWPGILAIGAGVGLAGGLLLSEARVSAEAERVAALEAQVQQLSERLDDHEYTLLPSWHVLKATGEPDCEPPLNRDNANAWAPATENGGAEWLELSYAEPQVATSVRVHQICSPGAVISVDLLDEAGNWHPVWNPLLDCKVRDVELPEGVLEATFPETDYRVTHVRVQLNTKVAPGWNEIDAVELVGPDARAWAINATASSSYGADVVTAPSCFVPTITIPRAVVR